MKVLQINSFFSVGGPPRIMNGIYDTLKEQGHECKIAAAREDFYAPEDSFRICSDVDVKINGVMARIFDNEGFNAKAATKKLIAQIEEYDPDIIHLHNLHGYCINVEILFDYLKKADKKVFWTLHDCWAFTGHCAYFHTVKCNKWQTKCENCPQKNEYPTSKVLSRAESNFERKKATFTGVRDMTIITPSHWLADLVKKSFLKEYPVKVVHNGIDTSVFKPTPSDIRVRYGLEDKKIVIGVAQVWADRKGLGDFLKLSNMLDESYKIVLVGLTDKQVSELPDNILGITRTKNATELAQWYTAADVFVNPSREETFGLTTVEAMACGTPVVVYKGTACEEIVENAIAEKGLSCGACVPFCDVDAIYKAITETEKTEDRAKLCVSCAATYGLKDNNEYVEMYNLTEISV